MLKSLSINTPYYILIANLHNVYAKQDLKILSYLLNNHNNLIITLSPQNKQQVLREIIQIESTFNQGIKRLRDAKLISKKGKTVVLSPIFKDYEQITGILIRSNSK